MLFYQDQWLYAIAYRFCLHLSRLLFFGDSLNAINISGIFVVNIGILLHKVTLNLSKSENKECQKIEEESHYFLCISDDDDSNDGFILYAEDLSARQGKR